MGISGSMAALGTWLGASAETAAVVGTMATGMAAGTAASMYGAHKQAVAGEEARQQQKDAAAQAEASRPQASKGPSVQAFQADQSGAGQAGGSPGVAQTFLTGAGGVDPSLLNLGKNTLLGGGG